MYLRIEQLIVREGAEVELGTFYREEALPIFGRTPGCRFAALLAPWHAADHLGLTLWESDEKARRRDSGAARPGARDIVELTSPIGHRLRVPPEPAAPPLEGKPKPAKSKR